jgi:hypothetical protein
MEKSDWQKEDVIRYERKITPDKKKNTFFIFLSFLNINDY